MELEGEPVFYTSDIELSRIVDIWTPGHPTTTVTYNCLKGALATGQNVITLGDGNIGNADFKDFFDELPI